MVTEIGRRNPRQSCAHLVDGRAAIKEGEDIVDEKRGSLTLQADGGGVRTENELRVGKADDINTGSQPEEHHLVSHPNASVGYLSSEPREPLAPANTETSAITRAAGAFEDARAERDTPRDRLARPPDAAVTAGDAAHAFVDPAVLTPVEREHLTYLDVRAHLVGADVLGFGAGAKLGELVLELDNTHLEFSDGVVSHDSFLSSDSAWEPYQGGCQKSSHSSHAALPELKESTPPSRGADSGT